MRINASLPQQRSARNTYGVHVGAGIAEVHGVAVGSEGNGSLHGGRSFVRPVDAPAARVERVDGTVFAAHEHAARKDRWLSEGGPRAGKAERPLELQLWDRVAVKASHAGRLKPAVRSVHAPPVPTWIVRGDDRLRRTGAGNRAGVRAGRTGRTGIGRQVFRHRYAFGRAKERALDPHRARFERAQ